MHLIADNFLDKEYFTRLKEIVLSSQFPWFYQSKVNVLHSEEDLELYFKAKSACSSIRGFERMLNSGPSGEYAQLSIDTDIGFDDDNEYENE